jgi:hypothetical protein
MWGTVLLMAVIAGVTPARIGAVAYILSRRRPTRLLVAYLVGGFGVSLIFGGLIVVALDSANVGKSSSIPPAGEIAVGAVALLVAVLVATGITARIRDSAKARRALDHGIEMPSIAGAGPHSIDSVPGFDDLPRHLQDALRSESPWIAWVAGVAVGMPTSYYLAAIAAILNAGVGSGGQVSALLVFNVIAFAAAEIPLVGFLIAPDSTRARVDQVYRWISAHQRLIITALAAIAGTYLILIGLSKI